MTRLVSILVISKESVAPVLGTLALGEIGEDLFRVHSLPQVHRIYSGQMIAQALVITTTVVDRPRLSHSFHTYFAREGIPSLPLELRVEHLRDGRLFSLRHIVCLQGGREILALQVSHRGPEDGLVFTSEAPEITPSEELPSVFEIFRAINHPASRFLGKTTAFDVCHVQQPLYTKADKNPSNRQQLQIRPCVTILQGADQYVHRALLAYVINQVILEPAMRVLGPSQMAPGMSATSLDHAMWLHHDIDINEWFLFDGECTNISNSRTLVTTRVFTHNGVLLAEITQQEILWIPGHG